MKRKLDVEVWKSNLTHVSTNFHYNTTYIIINWFCKLAFKSRFGLVVDFSGQTKCYQYSEKNCKMLGKYKRNVLRLTFPVG